VPILGGESPFQRTLRRVAAMAAMHGAAGVPETDTPVVLVGGSGRFMAAEQAAASGFAVDLAIEPEGRDTLPAIAAAAMLAAARDPAAMVLVLPSDHLVPDTAAFAATVARGIPAASAGALVTFGIAPTAPATAYGYIRPRPTAADIPADSARPIAAFEEKPDRSRAAALIAEGCLWNAGMFLFRATDGVAEMERLAPDVVAAVRDAVAQADTDLGALRLGASFATARKVSFDYAVMEHTDRGVVVPAAFAWSDIGDWRELWLQADRDGHGVATEGDAVVIDSRDSYIRGDNRLVCALGVENLAIIDTPDALLVTTLDRTQEVKGLVALLAGQGRPEATTPARVYRPWGWYQTMDLGERFRVKRIQVAPGKKLSLQKHHHRAEHWVVVRGTAEVTRDHETLLVRENESVYLPLGCVHRLANPGKIPVEIIEVQTGAYLEEDDIVRIEDDFGRL
jgi:mannose-1-phosphate guanylyltransferase/mannose-6-phosphate isomerase